MTSACKFMQPYLAHFPDSLLLWGQQVNANESQGENAYECLNHLTTCAQANQLMEFHFSCHHLCNSPNHPGMLLRAAVYGMLSPIYHSKVPLQLWVQLIWIAINLITSPCKHLIKQQPLNKQQREPLRSNKSNISKIIFLDTSSMINSDYIVHLLVCTTRE